MSIKRKVAKPLSGEAKAGAKPPARTAKPSVKKPKSEVKAAKANVKTKLAAAVSARKSVRADATAKPAVTRRRKAAPKAIAKSVSEAKFSVGDVVRHRFYGFRGVIFDIDPVFANTDDWWLAIPEKMRPRKDQPFYHLLAENAETEYVAYVSEQNLLPDRSGVPVRHPQVPEYFVEDEEGHYRSVFLAMLN